LDIALAENVTHQIRSGSNASESLSHRTWKTTQSGKWSRYCGTTESRSRPSTEHAVWSTPTRRKRSVCSVWNCNAGPTSQTPTWTTSRKSKSKLSKLQMRRRKLPSLQPPPQEVLQPIRGLKNRKAPGPDNISNRALKNLPEKAVVVVTENANGMFRLRHFPAHWKTANVIFIPKPEKNPKFSQNHRPIGLLSRVGKVIEKLIHFRLAKVTHANHTIPDEQFGFRPKHSTTDQLLRVTEYASVSSASK
jgi:hypothetical protein